MSNSVEQTTDRTTGNGATDAEAAPGGARSRKRRLRWWQKLLLISFALVPLALLELALTIFGYGPDVRFVVPRLDRGETRVMGVNPQAWKLFHFRPLGDESRTVHFAPWREFVEPKPPGTYRVFFLGGSSVAGYPHAQIGAAPAFLQELLQAAWPERQVEVINCGVTAINSYSLRHWIRELPDHEPDLFVVYAGHNEFYGAYGAASRQSIGTNRRAILAHIWLRGFRTAQLMGDLLGAVAGGQRAPASATLMEVLAEQRSVRLDDEVYVACRENFRANIADMARTARDAGVPIVLCGLVSNERDLVPMQSSHRTDLTENRRQEWQTFFEAGTAALAIRDYHEARRCLEAAMAIDDTHAELVYRTAQCRESQGDIEEARQLYRRARDLDTLRFRATTEFTQVIRDLARDVGAVYADVPAAFEARATNGLIGWDLMTDHLHPTVEGHYLIARAICEALNAAGVPVEIARLPGCVAAAARLGNDSLSDMLAKMSILRLSKGFPYEGTPNAVLHDRTRTELQTLEAALRGPTAEGFQSWAAAQQSAFGGHTEDPPHYFAGEACVRTGDRVQAIHFFQTADAMSEPHSLASARARCAIVRCRADDPAGAVPPITRSEVQAARAYVRDCIRLHPEDRGPLERLAKELEQSLKSSSPSSTRPE